MKFREEFVPYYKVYYYSAGQLHKFYTDAQKYRFATIKEIIEKVVKDRRYQKLQIVVVHCTDYYKSQIVKLL